MMKPGKHFLYLLITFTTFFMVLLGGACINYFVDPAHLFQGGSFEHGVAKLLAAGENVANISNCDERQLQRFYVGEIDERKETLVFGSSRSMQIRAALFDSESFFNHSVSGCSIEDYLAIYEMHSRRGFIPNRIILGVDPWIFNASSNQSRWRSIKKYYFSIFERIDKGKMPRKESGLQLNDKYSELLSVAYLRRSLSSLVWQQKKSAQSDFYPIHADSADVPVKRWDGSHYEANYERKSKQEIQIDAISFVSKPYSLQGFHEIDKNTVLLFEKFIDFLKREKVAVVLFLPPYHPLTYPLLMGSERYKIIDKVESYLKELSLKKDVLLIGSFDPVKAHCDKSEFYDGMHPRESCVNRIFQEANL